LLGAAPKLMKSLSVIGTAAMFMVGGGILVHGVPAAHHLVELWAASLGNLALAGPVLHVLAAPVLNGLAGVVAGGIVLAVVSGFQRLRLAIAK
jgi:predicted DNA repair protein MutK